MRYAFVVAGLLLPWLTAPLPPRFSRKAVAAAQGVVLVTAVSGLLPPAAAVVALSAALAALCWSFGRDVVWLARRRAEHRLAEQASPRARDDVVRVAP